MTVKLDVEECVELMVVVLVEVAVLLIVRLTVDDPDID